MPKRVTDAEMITALLTHGGVSKAAKALKITRQAVYKRLQDDELKSAYIAAQGALMALGAGMLASSVDDAVAALRAVLNDPSATNGAKTQAADAILRHCARYVELASFESRLSALERTRAAEEKSCG